MSDPDWRTASQPLDDLMRKLLVVHRLLEAEERLAKPEAIDRADVMAAALSVKTRWPVRPRSEP